MDKMIYNVLQHTDEATRYKIVAALFPTYKDVARMAAHITESFSATQALLSGVDDYKIAKYLRRQGYIVRPKEK